MVFSVGPTRAHLSYCTNIHPGETWAEVLENLSRYCIPLKAILAPEERFGIGLRLSALAAKTLLQPAQMAQFQAFCESNGFYVFTMNGFPYGRFHGTRIKSKVYAPDWRTEERVTYTQNLVRILAQLSKAGDETGISTVPLSFKAWGVNESDREQILKNLLECVHLMVNLKRSEGVEIHLDLEPEPGALLETGDECVRFFKEWLLAKGAPHLAKTLGLAREQAELTLLEHVRVCYDTCHIAVEYEEPEQLISAFHANGIRIGKVQISSALKVKFTPDDVNSNRKYLDGLSAFTESTYLHQVLSRHPDGKIDYYEDLPLALGAAHPDTMNEEWRIHFHVPIFLVNAGAFSSTRDHIEAFLRLASEQHLTNHYEVETYTWDVLPSHLHLSSVTESVARELQWVLSQASGD